MILRFFFAALLSLALVPSAQAVDPIHVVSHDKVLVVTDPSQGVKYYPQLAVFPSTKTDYRRVVLSITYRCPDGKRCGEWDYIDGVLLTSTKHAVGTIAGKKQIELARVISPYGWQFDSTWFFTWKADITDFGMLLHDSCEITFKHTGYESNTDRGWVVTLDFEITPGRAPMKCLGIDTLWAGSFPYGDTAKPIEQSLAPISIGHPKAKYARVWLMQTGHGMDETENCAEFCRKWRKVILNDGTRDTVIDQRDLWKECSENPLYPQAGTWPFDRANWCPGDIVTPDMYTFPINSKRDNSLEIEMQPYVSAKPTANWYINGYVFYYSAPRERQSLQIESIRANRSALQLGAWNSEIAGELEIVIRNNGVNPIEKVRVSLWQEVANYNGPFSAPSFGSDSIFEKLTRPGEIVTIKFPFDISLSHSQGSRSRYVKWLSVFAEPADGRKHSGSDGFERLNTFFTPQVAGGDVVFECLTNKEPTHNSVTLTDSSGHKSLNYTLGSLPPLTLIRDTLKLTPGNYFLHVTDTAGDGLGFWFNPEAGYGYVRLLDSQGRLLKAFTPDFGGSLYYSFIVTDDSTKITPPDSTPQVIVFPPRNFGTFDIDLFASWPTDMTIEIVSDSGEVVLSQKHDQVKQLTLPMDITAQKDGIYYVHVITERDLIKKRIRLKRS